MSGGVCQHRSSECVPRQASTRMANRSRVIVGIGESIGGIQRRQAVHPFRRRRKASGVLEREQAHRPIHVYGNWSICRDRCWKLSGISFNPTVETSSSAVRCYPIVTMTGEPAWHPVRGKEACDRSFNGVQTTSVGSMYLLAHLAHNIVFYLSTNGQRYLFFA